LPPKQQTAAISTLSLAFISTVTFPIVSAETFYHFDGNIPLFDRSIRHFDRSGETYSKATTDYINFANSTLLSGQKLGTDFPDMHGLDPSQFHISCSASDIQGFRILYSRRTDFCPFFFCLTFS